MVRYPRRPLERERWQRLDLSRISVRYHKTKKKTKKILKFRKMATCVGE
jgi:hypothetical protein